MGKLEKLYDTLYAAFGPQRWWPGETPFEVAVGAVLTQNINWGNVEKAINNLKKAGALDPFKMYKMSETRLSRLIKPTGYFNVKAKRLKALIFFIVENYAGSMEEMKKEDTALLREKLLAVKGIGEETADSILLYALEKPVFVIDAYTKRVLSRHNIMGADEPYSNFQKKFHRTIKKETALYNEYHALFVKLGKDYCKPKPACGECPLNGNGFQRKTGTRA
jgi:endonuclease-3 related protein